MSRDISDIREKQALAYTVFSELTMVSRRRLHDDTPGRRRAAGKVIDSIVHGNARDHRQFG